MKYHGDTLDLGYNIFDIPKRTTVIPLHTAFYNLMNEAAQIEDYEKAIMFRDTYNFLLKDRHPVTGEILDYE